MSDETGVGEVEKEEGEEKEKMQQRKCSISTPLMLTDGREESLKKNGKRKEESFCI